MLLLLFVCLFASGENTYKCISCPFSTMTISQLKDHSLQEHGETLTLPRLRARAALRTTHTLTHNNTQHTPSDANTKGTHQHCTQVKGHTFRPIMTYSHRHVLSSHRVCYGADKGCEVCCSSLHFQYDTQHPSLNCYSSSLSQHTLKTHPHQHNCNHFHQISVILNNTL